MIYKTITISKLDLFLTRAKQFVSRKASLYRTMSEDSTCLVKSNEISIQGKIQLTFYHLYS